MSKALVLDGKIFGRLTVLEKIGHDKNHKVMWKCVCSCENKTEVIVRGSYLVSGKIKVVNVGVEKKL